MNPNLFITKNLEKPISKQEITLDDGLKCFTKLSIKPDPKEHEAGSWCPKTVTDSKENRSL